VVKGQVSDTGSSGIQLRTSDKLILWSTINNRYRQYLNQYQKYTKVERPDGYILQELQSLELQPAQESPARDVGIPPSSIVKQANRDSIRSDGF
jgi:hypothetical protein